MEDSFEKLADIIKENNLGSQALDYLADIKRELKEKERLEWVAEERYRIENNALFRAYNLACYELEKNDNILFDLYDRLDTYYETKDRYEWKEHFLKIAEEETWE